MELSELHENKLHAAGTVDVAQTREYNRMRRIRRAGVWLGLLCIFMWYRILTGDPIGMPGMPEGLGDYLPAIILVSILLLIIVGPMLGAGRSPHVLYRPSELDVSLNDVRGADIVKEEVVRTLNLFLAHKTFKEKMGGTPRRAILFEGPPGTGKTYIAKAMAAEAGVPFLFVSSSAFQSMYYGQTNRKIRSYFKALRKHAQREGGAIGFIEEIDAIGASRGGMGGGGGREGVAGVVNELLIQMQSFDEPKGTQRMKGWFIDLANSWLPPHRQLKKDKPVASNVLVVGATNRAADLDPALLRPGRFDRTITIDIPSRSGRRDIIDYYLGKKAHHPELDSERRRETLAAMTSGYSPVMLEHLLDEALIWALRRGASALSWEDVQQAKMTEELGLKQPVEYTEAERRTIATHEAGHATVAALVGAGRKLEVLSIIKRGAALGMLAHSDLEERWTNTRTELEARIQISMGGMVAEELFFGESGTGPSGDLHAATSVAAQMVGSFGMGDTLASFEAVQTGSGNIVAKVMSNEETRDQVEKMLRDAKEFATDLLTKNRHIVEALRDALLDREELIGEEILEIVAWAQTTGARPVRFGRGPDGELILPDIASYDVATVETFRNDSRGALPAVPVTKELVEDVALPDQALPKQ